MLFSFLIDYTIFFPLSQSNKLKIKEIYKFSAILAFSSYISAILLGKKYIVLSNEASANEANVEGTNINHQYSKSIEFENDFRWLTNNYLDKNIEEIHKLLKEKKLIWQFDLKPDVDYGKIFNIFSTAKHNSPKAIEMLEDIKNQEDPIMFFGLLVSSALKDFNAKPGTKEKKVLKLLSSLDLKIKTSSLDPWLIIESFLAQLSKI